MNMFRFTLTTPNRDGSLDNGIPVHEFVHGVSNRLTGGSAQGNCLQTSESRGMGEGWSDTVAIYLGRKATDTRATDVTMGSYAVNKPAGIRSYPYSTDLAVNPLSYNSLNTLDEVHDIGEIWATILNEVYWNLVDKSGYSSNWLDANQTKGNIIALKVVIGGMKLQPCNPTFINARDAILKADEANYGGANKCLIWKAFAKRGLGVKATDSNGYSADSSLPANC
ncbi:peptidase M36 [Globomyces pollinis-pini]|nr:peptidase M36 [Globomyces pollinis-pini]